MVYTHTHIGSYIQRVKSNAQALAAGLRERGHDVATDGTDNHLLLWDLRPKGLTGSKMEKLLEACSISANKVGVRRYFSYSGVLRGYAIVSWELYTNENERSTTCVPNCSAACSALLFPPFTAIFRVHRDFCWFLPVVGTDASSHCAE